MLLYHDNGHVRVEILTVIRMEIAFLPVPAIVRDFVKLVVQVARVEVFSVH